VDEEIIRDLFNIYIEEKINLYSKPKNFKTTSNGDLKYGINSYLYTLNEKKPFLTPQTSFFYPDSVYALPQSQNFNIYKFYVLNKNNVLPNPVPIFIENRELNHDVVRFLRKKNEKNTIGYQEIIKLLFEEKKGDLGNYILLYMHKGKDGIKIRDVDYVESFDLHIDLKIFDLIGNNNARYKIENIFQFEEKILKKIFLNSKGIESDLQYFNKIEEKNFYSEKIFILALKYRRAWYDFIYKSRRHSITHSIIKDMFLTSIYEDIRLDEKSKNFKRIREKLNIWFSINHFFDTENINFQGEYMATKIPELREGLQTLIDDKADAIESDALFSYALGQIVHFVLSRSRKENKTHSHLVPYLQAKTLGKIHELLQRDIIRYAHELYDYNGSKFNRIMAQVTAYTPEKEKSVMSDMHPVIMAGYFDNSLLYGKIEQEENKNEENENG